jgi:hypothetical protein
VAAVPIALQTGIKKSYEINGRIYIENTFYIGHNLPSNSPPPFSSQKKIKI